MTIKLNIIRKIKRNATLVLAILASYSVTFAQNEVNDTVTVTTLTSDSLKIETVVTKTVITRTTTTMPRAAAQPAVTHPIVAQPQASSAALQPEEQFDEIAVGVVTYAEEPVKETKPAAIPIFSRDIESVAFVPRGQWIGGVSVSYSQSTQNNYQFLILQGLNADTYAFKVSPMIMYAFKDNLAAGARFAFTRSRNRLDNASVVLDSETSYDVDHLHTISQNYSGTLAFRNYMSLGAQTRFGLFNEVQVEIGGGQSKIENGSGLDYTGTFMRTFNLGIGLAPGLVMFLNNYSAIEVNVGVLGFDYKHNHSVTDRIYVSDIKTKSANFRVNLFSIVFGATFYI